MKRITLLCAFFALAQFAHADVYVLETDGLVAKGKPHLAAGSVAGANPINAHIAKPGEKHHGIPLGGIHPSATGSQQLIDASGLKYFINTNITFSTTSSASGAMSEASYTHAVAATTSGGGVTGAILDDSFDGYNTLCVSLNGTLANCATGNANFTIYNQNGASTNECNGRQIVFPTKVVGGLNVSRKVYVPTDDSFARWLNIVTNTSGAPLTFGLITANNLGSDNNTLITGSSSGTIPPTIADNWVATFQNFSGTTSSDPRLGHVLQGPGAATPLSGINFANGDDNPWWAYTVTLNPGETKILMNYVTALGSKAAAATQAAALTALPYTSLECLTAAEKLQVSNFAIPTPTAIQATKTYSGETFVGGTGIYTVVLTNTGGTAQQDNPGDEFTDVLPANLTLVSATATSGTATTAASTAHWNGSLAPAASVTITINVAIASGAVGSTVSNQGTAFFDADGNGTNEASTLTDDPAISGGALPDPTNFVITGGSIISGTKTVSGTYVVGNTVTYTVVLTNSGAGPQADNPGNEFSDVLPATLQLVSATATSGTAVGNVGTNTVTWNGALAASSSVTITINGTILPSAAGQNVSNQGTISYDSDGNGTNDASAVTDDPAVGGAADPTVFAVTGGANVAGTKSVSGTFTIGNTVTYNIVLTNNGAGPQADNPGSEFTDVLPATLQLVSASATSGTAVGNVGTNTATWDGALASSASVTITITATILPSAAGHTVSNQGAISYDSDGNGSNDAAAATSFPGGVGPTVFLVAALPAVAIPSSTTMSLAWLALAFAALAFFALRRRI
ncbi:DUF11 domain-containing protein [Pseudolysobacter antarcticus]|uniref:DUF11 domain-containing protein n=1 Tax=Pseudolysobacter antarcticus TaxID=2511995 RepID=A0A411HKD5_9GAMM|nr:DUF11 domain-containing protein [Pseudolysobacter antarcticus]QBB70963.1 DUF11 domain-containing protein [Pseudolysobacter antarcticus]